MDVLRYISDEVKDAGKEYDQYTLDEIMIFNQGYSHKYKELARERVERLKEQNHKEIVIRKQKIKELSKQTNELRKKIKDKSKTLEEEEEERRATILENRKLKQSIATEKFQRIQKRRIAKGKKTTLKNGLKNGFYHVRDHVIEIKDGKRVSSIKQNEEIEAIRETSSHRNTYAPDSYLSTHLNNLINNGQNKDAQVIELDRSNGNNIITHRSAKPLLLSRYCDSEDANELAQNRIALSMMRTKSPASSECSADSLEDDGQEERMLKSSLKISCKDSINEACYRKVTFSDSIEFNDGNTGRLGINALEGVPLYKRIEKNPSENEYPIAGGMSTPTVTADEALDMLREQVLKIEPPKVLDSDYPQSVVMAIEQLSSPKGEALKDVSNCNCESSVNEGEPIKSQNEYLIPIGDSSGNHQKEEKQSSLNANGTGIEENELENRNEKDTKILIGDAIASDIECYDYDKDIPHNSPVFAPQLSPDRNSNEIGGGSSSKQDDHCPLSHSEYQTNGKLASCSPEECTAVNQNTYLATTERYNPFEEQKSENFDHLIEKYSLSETKINASRPKQYPTTTCETSTVQTFGSVSQKNNQTGPEDSSGVLYVPKYPYFPSKERRYSSNGAYEGRSPINYHQRQYGNECAVVCSDNQSVSSTVTSSNSPSSFAISKRRPQLSSKIVDSEVDNEAELEPQGVTKEVSVSYINITARDVTSHPSQATDHMNPDDLYKEIERTLADLTFTNPSNVFNEEANYTSSKCRNVPGQTEQDAPIGGILDYNETQSKYNEHKIAGENKILDVKGKSAIPVRHNQNTVQNNAARRGRIIVSADNKRRKGVGHMMPRPPAKPKASTNFEKNSRISSDNDRRDELKDNSRENSNTRIVDRYGDKIRKNENQIYSKNDNQLYSNYNHSDTQIQSQRVLKQDIIGVNGQKCSSPKANYAYHADQDGDRSYINMNNFNNTDKDIELNDNLSTNVTPNSSNLPRSYVRASPNTLPWSKYQSNNQASYIPLEKTPTDEEINKLWTNVRQCIITEKMEHAYSDSNYIIDNHYRKQYRRTLSGSSLDRRTNDRVSPRIYGNRQQNHSPGLNHRYGSYEALNRQIVNDNSNPTSNFINKPSLLPQRATKVIRNSNFTNENKYTLFKGTDNVSVSDRKYQYDTQLEKYNDVSASMASFLVLEELCKKQTLSPRQADAVFQASKTVQQKHRKEIPGVSALSIEERCVMQSLERLNEKLKEKELKTGDLKLMPKAQIIDSRPRLYSNH